MDTIYFNCKNYCEAVGRGCTGAWEEDLDTCNILSTEDCLHDFGAYTSDAICECGSESSEDKCSEELWPDIKDDIICGDCKVKKGFDYIYL